MPPGTWGKEREPRAEGRQHRGSAVSGAFCQGRGRRGPVSDCWGKRGSHHTPAEPTCTFEGAQVNSYPQSQADSPHGPFRDLRARDPQGRSGARGGRPSPGGTVLGRAGVVSVPGRDGASGFSTRLVRTRDAGAPRKTAEKPAGLICMESVS